MAHGYKIKGVDISELYEYTGEEPYIEIPGYLSRGSKFKFNTYNAVYNGGWGPDYVVDPSNYNYTGVDVLNLKKCAPKNTIIRIEHDAYDYTVAKSKLDLCYEDGSGQWKQYYVKFNSKNDTGNAYNQLVVSHYDYTQHKEITLHTLSVDKEYIIVRMVGAGGYGGGTGFSGGGGATFIGLMRPSDKKFYMSVGRGGGPDANKSTYYTDGRSIISVDNTTIVVADCGASAIGSLTEDEFHTRIAKVSVADSLVYDYFRPICTSDFMSLASLPQDRDEWPMIWGVDGGQPGTNKYDCGYFQSENLYVSNVEPYVSNTKLNEESSMYSEYQSSSYIPNTYVISDNTQSSGKRNVRSGGSSFCGRGSRNLWKSEPSDSVYNLAKKLIDSGRLSLSSLFAETGGGGGCAELGTKFYNLLNAYEKVEAFKRGGDGKVSFFW